MFPSFPPSPRLPFFFLLFLPFFFSCTFTGCTNTPVATRAAAASTLQTIGLSAKGAIDSAAILLREGKITRAQWEQVASFYDSRFQPAFALAIAAAQSDLSSPATPDVLSLAAQLTTLLASFTTQ